MKVLLLGVVLTLALVGGCDGGAEERSEGHLGAALEIRTGSSGVIAPEPATEKWEATFGEIVLCTSGNEPVVIDSIKFVGADHTSGDVTPFLRSIPLASFNRGEESLIGGMMQSPAELFEAGEIRAMPREFGPGLKFASACDPSDATEASLVELLASVRASRQGIHVSGVDISYSVGGRRSTAHADREFVVCGRKTLDVKECAG